MAYMVNNVPMLDFPKDKYLQSSMEFQSVKNDEIELI